MRKPKEVPTTEYLRQLYEAGDIEGLRLQNEILAKRANTRLSALEKAGLDTTAAYKRATKSIKDLDIAKTDRFSRSKKLDLDELYDQVKSESNFLRWQTSTPAGEVKRREAIWESLTSQTIDPETGDIKQPYIDLSDVYKNLPEGADIDAALTDYKKNFLDFLDSNAWKDIKKRLYSSHILNDAGEAVAAGASVEDLNEAYRSYKEGETDKDLFTIWSEWTSVAQSK